jgi:hypothetical protein
MKKKMGFPAAIILLLVQFGCQCGKPACGIKPYIEKETIRVELIPGAGRVVSFKLGEDGKVKALSYEGQEYKRVI